MFCQDCGQENVDSATYCVACGSRILVPQSVDSANSNYSSVPKTDEMPSELRESRPPRQQRQSNASEVGLPNLTELNARIHGTAQQNIDIPSIAHAKTSKTIRLGQLELRRAEALYAIGCLIAIVGLILPFYTVSTGEGTPTTFQMSVNLITRGFWWLIAIWVAAGVANHKNLPLAGIASGGFTIIFCAYFLVSWLMNGTTPGIGAFAMAFGGATMLAASIVQMKRPNDVDLQTARPDAPTAAHSIHMPMGCATPYNRLKQRQTKTCPACGYEEELEARFCGNCGVSLSETEPDMHPKL